MRSIITKAAAFGALALLGACATTTEYVAPLPVEATLSNFTGRTIARVEYQTCGDSSGNWSPLSIGEVAPGQSTKFQLPADCVNMNAYHDNGRLAGSQTGVKRDFPFKWTLS
jgi:hypothetical protein